MGFRTEGPLVIMDEVPSSKRRVLTMKMPKLSKSTEKKKETKRHNRIEKSNYCEEVREQAEMKLKNGDFPLVL